MSVKKKIKSIVSAMLVFALLLIPTFIFPVEAGKEQSTRSIAIVLDNSGSMYNGKIAWSQASYAIEVFAYMMNDGDELAIYPMHPFNFDGSDKGTYSDSKPLVINDKSQVKQLKDMFSPETNGTPFTTVDKAYEGLKKMNGEQKWLVVLTDGDFDIKVDGKWNWDEGYNREKALAEVNETLEKYLERVSIAFLAINTGEEVHAPDIKNDDYFKYEANESIEVTDKLAKMSTLIFGRDELDNEKYFPDFKGPFDLQVPATKVYVFAQGKNVEELSLKTEIDGKPVNPGSTFSPHYGEKGGKVKGNLCQNKATNLVGCLAEFDNLEPGKYTVVGASGADNINVYYEPDAQVLIKLVDSEGKEVDISGNDNIIKSGSYKLKCYLADSEGNDITDNPQLKSEAYGTPNFSVKYELNGEEKEFKNDKNGEISLSTNDEIKIDELSAEILTGYEMQNDNISEVLKSGIKIQPKLGLQVLPLDGEYVSSSISKCEGFKVFVTLDDKKLTSDELEKVDLKANAEGLEFAKAKKLSDESAFLVKFAKEQKAAPDDYKIEFVADGSKNGVGEGPGTASTDITVSRLPFWAKMLISFLALIALIAIIVAIMRIKVMPKCHSDKRDSNMIVDGDDVTQHSSFESKMEGRTLKVCAKYGGKATGFQLNCNPAKDSYLCKPSEKRKATAESTSFRKNGIPRINSAKIGTIQYLLNDNNKLERVPASDKPFDLKHRTPISYSGTMNLNGEEKEFTVKTILNYKKKK